MAPPSILERLFPLFQTTTVELIDGGANIPVTEENKERYIEAVVNWRFVKRVEKQMEQLLRGLHEVNISNRV